MGSADAKDLVSGMLEGSAMRSLEHVDIETFCRDPRGHVATVGPFVIWCVDETLSGISFPPSATMAEIDAMIAVSKRSPLPGMTAPYDIIVDERRLTSLASAAMTVFLGFLANEISIVTAPTRDQRRAQIVLHAVQRTLSVHGISFVELVDRKRQRIAEERLQAGHKAEAIALDLGFASLSSFSRFFRRRVGIAPSQYRRRELAS